MCKRLFISVVIRSQHYTVIICLLMFIVGSQNISAQSQLAQDAYAIFEASCLNCHGPDGAFRETLLMEHSALIEKGTVVPGNADASELYKRLLGPTENGAQMPLGQTQLSATAIDSIRRWITAGAPDWTTAPITTRRFISPTEILKAIDTHAKTISPFDRPFTRYFTMTHLYNAGVPPDILAEYRKALAKLVNSLSWGLEIVNPQFIDIQQTIFYIDLRHYEWDRNAGWAQIEQAYPYHVELNAPSQTALRNQLSRLQTTLETDVPAVNVDWFIAVASSPPLYNALLSLPETDDELEKRLEVDVDVNIMTAPGFRVWRAGFTNSGVSNHNRVVERHASRYGAYWKSYDFAGSSGTRNIFTHPFAFTHDGGEVIFNLPNGLQGYYLVDGDGFRLDAAPISIVSNPAASDPTVRNGLSCIGCHTEGMKEIDDEVRAYIESDTNPAYNKPHALQLYVADSTMDSKVNNDRMRYQGALQLTGGDLDDIEPVSRFHEEFQRSVDAEHAAAAVGLPTETFLEKIRTNAGLQDAGLLVLDSENGTVKRDSWTSSFQDVIHALDYPRDVGDVPVETRPDLLPGRPVTIPDPNLKALLEETLETKRITVDDMSKLIELNAKNQGISDLIGLEFAINLETLNISENLITDLSPISKCTNLRRLILWPVGNGDLTDILPLSNLTKLELLKVKNSNIKDISALEHLKNMRELQFYSSRIDDISVLANLTKLERLTLGHHSATDINPIKGLNNLVQLNLSFHQIGDLSPLENLTQLESLTMVGREALTNIEPLRHLTNLTFLKLRFNFKNTHVSDISPLAGMTKLRVLEIFESNLTDISPLENLIGLETLHLYQNTISDITPLAGLNRLRRLELHVNNISDFSPIAHLIDQLERFEWHANPGYPEVRYRLTPMRIGEGSTFLLEITASNLFNVAGFQFDFVFRPNMIEAVKVTEGDFLKSDGGTTFFQGGQIDNTKGTITKILAGRITEGGVSGSGTVVKIALKAKTKGETRATLRNMQFGSINDELIPLNPPSIPISIGERRTGADVNGDGIVNILDLIRVAQSLGKRDANTDVNGDGIVNIFDLTIVAQKLGGAAAPSLYRSEYEMIEAWIVQARLKDDGSIAFKQGIANLETLLRSLLPDKTALLPNYPNPFNPETWIPYQLAAAAEVTLTIYDMNGGVVRRLEVGHQPAGVYQNRNRAVYWDGRNQDREPVASGLYFYTLKAGDFTATRKMLIRK